MREESDSNTSFECDPDVSCFDEFDFHDTDSTEIEHLKKEVKTLKTQMKQLKRMMVLSVFGSKQEFADFFSDIW